MRYFRVPPTTWEVEYSDEDMARQAHDAALELEMYRRELEEERRRTLRQSAQRREGARRLQEIELAAERFAGHWAPTILERIVCGDYPPEFAQYSAKRVGVLERAALIVLDIRRGRRAKTVSGWSREALGKHIAKLKARRSSERERQKARQAAEQARRNRKQKMVPIVMGKAGLVSRDRVPTDPPEKYR